MAEGEKAILGDCLAQSRASGACYSVHQNGWTDWDAVSGSWPAWPKEPCIRSVLRTPMERSNCWGWSAQSKHWQSLLQFS